MSKVQQASIDSLHPTQLTVGLLEVKEKRKHLASLSSKAQADFLAAHPMPAVIGPGKKLYITDHHHLARAALDGGVKVACFEVEADLRSLGTDEFWAKMDENSWVHPLDQNGVRHRYVSLPDHLSQLGQFLVEDSCLLQPTAGPLRLFLPLLELLQSTNGTGAACESY